MSKLQKFRKGYLEKFHEPRLISGYSGKVCTDACFMMLEEIPSEYHRVTIKGYNEVLNLNDIKNENDFYVDYTNNYIYFHKSKMGQTITVDDYYGIGLNFIGASRIIVRSNVTEDVIETLEDLIEQAKLCLEAITTLGGATEVIEQLKEDTETGRKVDKQLKETIKSGEATVQAIKDTGNKSFIVNKTDWTSTTNGYKYTLTHNLQSINLHVSMIDLTDNMAYPSQYKIIDVNKIEVYAMEKIKANVVISAKYYNGLGDNVGDNIVQEVADARGGMTSLGDKIRDMDSQLTTEIDNINSSLEEIDNKAEQTYVDVLNIDQYKAKYIYMIKADGITDDTDALQRYASSSNYVIWLPKGTILIDDTITFTNKKIIGNNTIIKLKNNATAFTGHKSMFILKGSSECCGVTFDGNYDGNYITDSKGVVRHFVNVDGVGGDEPKGSSAIIISNGLHSSVHHCIFRDISWSSCDIASGKYIEVYRNVFLNGARDYVPVHGASHVRVYDNLAYYPTNHAYHAYSNLKYCTIENNITIYNNDYKKEYVGYDARCAMYVDHGSYPESEVANTIVRNNKVIQEDKSYSIDCLRVVAYAKDVEICGNSFEDIIGFGIRIFSPTIGKCLIYDNTISTTEQCIQFKPELASGGNITYTSTGINGYMNIYNNTLSSSNNNIYQIYTVTDKLNKYYNILIEDNKYVNYKDYVITINKLNVKYKLTINDTMNYQIKKFDDLIKGKFYIHEDKLEDYRVISSLSNETINNGEFLIYKNTSDTIETVTSIKAGRNGYRATLLVADGTIKFDNSGNIKIKDNLTSDIYRVYELFYYGVNWFIK